MSLYYDILQFYMQQLENQVQNDFNVNHKDQDPNSLYNRSRTNFVRKVYTILSLQLAITCGFVMLNMFNSAFAKFQKDNVAAFVIFAIISIVLLLVIFCVKGVSKSFPLNMILLGIFTIAEGYIVSYTCSFYTAESVLLAAVATLGITIGLTIFAFTTKTDFTGCSFFLSGFLFSVFIMITLLSLVNLFLIKSTLISNLIAIALACIYCLYLIIDTQLILGGKNTELTMDNYVLGAVVLYIDIIGLFLQLLKLLGQRK